MKERFEEVEGIPSGILTCYMNEKEVGVTKCSPTSITIRVLEIPKSIERLVIHGYHFKAGRYLSVVPKKWCIEETWKDVYAYYMTFEIDDESYAVEIRKIQREYMEYIRCKLSYDDSEVSAHLVNYPAEKEESFFASYEEMEDGWLKADNWDCFWEKQKGLLEEKHIEIAVNLDTHNKYKKYLLEGREAIGRKSLPKVLYNKIGRLYIGNQFCPNQMPEIELLLSLLEQACKDGFAVTVTLSYLRDDRIDEMLDYIEKLAAWCKRKHIKLEIVCNDLGYLKMLETKKDVFSIALGILLHKRRKDPRYVYKKGYADRRTDFAENAWNSRILEELSKQYGIYRYEYESCGYEMKIAKGNHSLHLPLYQTNTSAYCPLHAVATQGSRSRQELVNKCSFSCERNIFAYPEHLKMMGKYNSLFAYDNSLLENANTLSEYIRQGIDRIVWNL